MNTKSNNNENKLPLIHEFYSIQGEGYHMGKAAYFIRIGGCDISCHWCDTKTSWNANIFKLVDIKTIVNNVIKNSAKSVVVTGGEPLMYNLDNLCKKLKQNNIETFIETSGSHTLSGKWNWICLSPKKQTPPLEKIYNIADELKVIVYSDDDFEWAEYCSKKVNKNCKLFLQPEWSMRKTNIKKIVEYIKTNIKWKISIQAHKYMKIP